MIPDGVAEAEKQVIGAADDGSNRSGAAHDGARSHGGAPQVRRDRFGWLAGRERGGRRRRPGAAEAPEAAGPAQGAEAAAEPDDLPFWDWSADQSELDDPSDAAAADRPESADGPDYPDYRAPASAVPALVARPGESVPRSEARADRARGDPPRCRVEGRGHPGRGGQADQPRPPGIGQRRGNLAHLSANPRMRVWQLRVVVAVLILVAFSILVSWQFGLTLAVIAIIADTIYPVPAELLRARPRSG